MRSLEMSIYSFILISSIFKCYSLTLSKYDVSQAEANLSQVHFLLWSRTYMDDFGYFPLVYDNIQNLEESTFDGSLNTYFLYHGYTDIGTKQWILDTKTELLKQEACNVISIDYGALVPSPNYPEAVNNMYDVSAYTAALIDWLVEIGGASTSRMHLTGHSLGAHAAGMTAKYVTSGEIDRVTGLDPAGPLFYNETTERRLDKSQAHFVDIIHTNGCSVARGCSGIRDSLGHADFFPCGGSYQAGCPAVTEATTGCSHQRVTSLWTESIVAGVSPVGEIQTFKSWPCDSWESFQSGLCTSCGFTCLNMGFHIQREYVDVAESNYYLYTNSVSPFALGDTQTTPPP